MVWILAIGGVIAGVVFKDKIMDLVKQVKSKIGK